MKSPKLRLLPILVLTVLACYSLGAQAIPKAAEHEGAPVTAGADVVRPRPSSKVAVQKKASSHSSHVVNKKSGKTTRHTPKTIHRKKIAAG